MTRQAAAAGRDWSFGWIRLAGDARRTDLARALADTDAAIVGSSGRLVRARLPGDAIRLREIATLDEVDALGATPAQAKLVAFGDGIAPPGTGAKPVFVTLMAEDADGRWRRAMEDLGAVVGGYDPALRVYRANAGRGVIGALAAADFVLAVEPIRLVEATHDTAVPAMSADALRAWDGAPGIFSGTGGASVPIAVMDTGLNINHLDIASHRDSICGANFAYNSGWSGADGPFVEADDLWIDDRGHGTHVTATVAGNGFGEQRFAGMAPGVRHIRFAKVLDSVGFGFGDSIVQGMDFLAQASRCSEAGRMSERVKPLIVNMSLSASARVFRGRGVGARKLDSTGLEPPAALRGGAVECGHRRLLELRRRQELALGRSGDGQWRPGVVQQPWADGGRSAGAERRGNGRARAFREGSGKPRRVCRVQRNEHVVPRGGGGRRAAHGRRAGAQGASCSHAGAADGERRPARSVARRRCRIPVGQHHGARTGAGQVRNGQDLGAHRGARPGRGRWVVERQRDHRAHRRRVRVPRHRRPGGCEPPGRGDVLGRAARRRGGEHGPERPRPVARPGR